MVKLMVDSAADIGAQEAAEKGILMIPMVIMIGNKEYHDGVDLSPQDFYKHLESNGELPKTGQVNAYRFEEEFAKHVQGDDELIVITISSKLSGTFENACQAAEKFEGKVHVVDSLNACIGERLLCEYAIKLIGQGLSADEIVAELEEKKGKIHVKAVLATLEYLKKGGRISTAVAFAGEVVSLKPVVGVVGGEVKLIGKAIGARKGTMLLNKLVESTSGIDFSMPFGTVYSGLDESIADKYIQDSARLFAGQTVIPKYLLGATIGTHVGPGVVGVAYFEK